MTTAVFAMGGNRACGAISQYPLQNLSIERDGNLNMRTDCSRKSKAMTILMPPLFSLAGSPGTTNSQTTRSSSPGLYTRVAADEAFASASRV